MATSNEIQSYIRDLVQTAKTAFELTGSPGAANISYTIEDLDVASEISAVFADINPKFDSFDLVINDGATINSLWTMFNTLPGERVMSPAWGSNTRKLLFENITMDLIEQATIDITKMLRQTDPRMTLNDVSILQNQNSTNVIDIIIDVSIKLINKRVKISIAQPV